MYDKILILFIKKVKADKEHDKPIRHLQDETIEHLDKKDKENN